MHKLQTGAEIFQLSAAITDNFDHTNGYNLPFFDNFWPIILIHIHRVQLWLHLLIPISWLLCASQEIISADQDGNVRVWSIHTYKLVLPNDNIQMMSSMPIVELSFEKFKQLYHDETSMYWKFYVICLGCDNDGGQKYESKIIFYNLTFWELKISSSIKHIDLCYFIMFRSLITLT